MKFPEGVRDKEAWVDLQHLDEHGAGLTQWEIEFVEKLTSLLKAGRMLTEAQRLKLGQIMEDRAP